MTAAELMAQHYRETVTDGDLWAPRQSGKFIIDCACGAEYFADKPRSDQDEHRVLQSAQAAHQLDALKAAGYAVVEIPDDKWISPSGARSLASALLAAADAAEASSL